MNNTIIGRLAAPLFAALIFLFSLQIVSCGDRTTAVETPSGKQLNSSGNPAATAVITYKVINCDKVTLDALADSTHGPGPKQYVFDGTADCAIPAGTQFKLVVTIEPDSTVH
ncbi:MAG TPA: hypothetical protein VGM31_14905 [Puia sp.]|jgi:hypothetical protein